MEEIDLAVVRAKRQYKEALKRGLDGGVDITVEMEGLSKRDRATAGAELLEELLQDENTGRLKK